MLPHISPLAVHAISPDLVITGIHQEDSRLIQPGNLFVARGGTKTDGSKFLDQACARGAVAVVTSAVQPGCPLPQIVVADPAMAASYLANAFFKEPSRSVKVIGVTGTNGKTTTAYLLRHVLNHFNLNCGMMGTVEIDDGRDRWESTITTPGPIEVAQLLAKMRDRGCKACAMEASSHSLHQARVAGVHFAGAVFTNLTGDHLDYHKTMEDYAAAKAKLFKGLDELAVAAVNAADPWTERVIRDTNAKIIRYGFYFPAVPIIARGMCQSPPPAAGVHPAYARSFGGNRSGDPAGTTSKTHWPLAAILGEVFPHLERASAWPVVSNKATGCPWRIASRCA